MGFDPKCLELAEHFLPEECSSHLKDELAQHVQSAVEDWLEGEADKIRADLADEQRSRQ